MTNKKIGWRAHEAYVQSVLGLDSTLCSGNKFHDPGDGVDRSHPGQNSFALIIDAKCTSTKSFSIKSELLREWRVRAGMLGKRFAMPIRFEDVTNDSRDDYILLTLDDFAELMSIAHGH